MKRNFVTIFFGISIAIVLIIVFLDVTTWLREIYGPERVFSVFSRDFSSYIYVVFTIGLGSVMLWILIFTSLEIFVVDERQNIKKAQEQGAKYGTFVLRTFPSLSRSLVPVVATAQGKLEGNLWLYVQGSVFVVIENGEDIGRIDIELDSLIEAGSIVEAWYEPKKKMISDMVSPRGTMATGFNEMFWIAYAIYK